nr:MAG TPA: hypothetical protein [Caudoviricetes sp.]
MNDTERLIKELKDLNATFKSMGKNISAIRKDLDRLTLSDTPKSVEEYRIPNPYKHNENSE